MNNEELKKKIAEIIDTTKKPCECLTVSECLRYENCKYQKREEWSCKAYAIAEALIAAGIGDVKEAERCAKVAERALRDRATYCAMEDLDYFSLTTVAVEARAKELYDGWMQQAEKDLAKEKQK